MGADERACMGCNVARKTMRYFTATFTFLFSFIGIAFIASLALHLMFRTEGSAVIGVSSDWRNIVGMLLGLAAGIHGWKHVMRKAREEKERDKF